MSASNYARRMMRLSSRIFGEVARPTNSTSMKVVKVMSAKPINRSPEIAEYYPRHNDLFHLFRNLRNLGLFRDEHQDFKDEMKRLRALRGKAKPKKGEGKRAMKRNK